MKQLGRESAVIALFCAITVVMTWPLAANFATALAHPQDPAITVWILDWDFYALTHSPLSLFDANIFQPNRLTFAFSENLLGIAILLLPLHLFGMAPIAIHNVALFLGFVLTAYGAYVLARLVTRSTGAAISGGIFFGFLTFRFTHLTHLQHLWALWLPLMLAALIWFSERPTAKRAAVFGAAFLMNGLTNLHWFAFGSVAIALTVLILARRDRRYWAGAIGAIAVACMLLLPVLLPYQQAREIYGLRGDQAETMSYSAMPADWLVAPLQSRWYAELLGDEQVNPERWLFPGFVVLVLAIAGLWFRPRRAGVVAVLWVLLGFAGSLGLHTPFGRFLFERIPLFSGIRTPARWSFIAYTGLALLAACGIATLTKSLQRRGRIAAHVVVAALLLVELFPRPIRWYLATPDAPPVYRYLASEADAGALIELPLVQNEQYDVLLRATTHHRPIANGVSGFTPPAFAELVAMTEQRPIDDQLLGRLEHDGITTVVVHADRLGATASSTRAWLASALAAGRLTFIGRFDAEVDGDYVFATRRHNEFERFADPPAHVRTILDRFLAGEPTQNETTFGFLGMPAEGAYVKDRMTVAGFALSPWGIREVNLRFANGRIVVPADLVDGPEIRERYPWYPMTTKSGFRKELERLDIPPGTDLQVEIIDGRGHATRLRDTWFTWAK